MRGDVFPLITCLRIISYAGVPGMLQPPHPKKILPIQDLLNGMSIDLQDVVFATD